MVAANPMEFPGILARANGTRTVAAAVGFARQARVGGNELMLAANGAGRSHASQAVDRVLRVFKAEAVISTGFCGALRPEIDIADLVVGTAVTSGGRQYATWPLPAPNRADIHKGIVCTANHVVQTAAEKTELAKTGAAAVEMEAAGVAECASTHGLPFSCVKAVTDLASETLFNDYNRALRNDGYFDTIVLLRGTWRHPFVRIQELFRLRQRCVRAAGVLGEFFADLRF